MEKHHQEAINIFIDRMKTDPSVQAILLGGSLAHGLAKADSDIDAALIVDEDEYRKRKAAGTLAFSLWDICRYEGGYVDCKVVSIEFLKKVAERGSDAARFAFKDSVILHSRLSGLETLLEAVTAFPAREKEGRRKRFGAQILAWKWMFGEGKKKGNDYLMNLAAQKIVLFSCRAVLNENELLFPFHKWLLAETARAPRKPEGFDRALAAMIEDPSVEIASALCEGVLGFAGLSEQDVDWPNLFMADSELNWLDHEPPVDDI
jgi:predicted nucleotidyltransferase